MKRTLICLSVVAAVVCALVQWSEAAPFEPVFKLTDVSGECMIKVPGSDEFVKVEEGKAYPYGSQLKTGKNSLMTIMLSEGNTCQLGAEASAQLDESKDDPSQKTLTLFEGKLEANLEEGFENSNGLTIQTPCSIVSVLGGGELTVDALTEADLNVVVCHAKTALCTIMGSEFEIGQLADDAIASVACATDGSFARIKNLNDVLFSIQVKDSEGNPRGIEMKKGSTVKIWRKLSADGEAILVQVVITGPEDQQMESFNYREPVSEQGPTGGTKPPPPSEVTTTTSTTTTTTTTTTTPEDVEQEEAPAPAPPQPKPAPPRKTPTDVGRGRFFQ